ncbi:MAG: uracil-DNA glycosylase [Balneolaceae bacterium]|nr:MAG: uracil-DNA glycosylase [Balneolaceae bacterium]
MPNAGKLLRQLHNTPDGYFFNPWYDHDIHHDRSTRSPDIRRRQLDAYLTDRIGAAKYVLVAEALGYQGGHFTGIAMTSERILLGHHQLPNGLGPGHVFSDLRPERTSLESLKSNGMNEPTATIVWNTVLSQGIDPFTVVHWNALAWHPYDPVRGLLSNRTPTLNEFRAGERVLDTFLDLYPSAKVLAVGRKSESTLARMGVAATALPHPAYGGAPKFRAKMAEIVSADGQVPI